jgi:hypothetical protein
VGNPPFIGGKDLRSRLGDVYAEALWAAHPTVGGSTDFVMHWWDHAARLLTQTGTALKRFGLVTTNSITQVFQRRVVAQRMSAQPPVSIVMAIPDHPWTKATTDAAAVRISMTVGERGRKPGILREVAREGALDTDAPIVSLREANGFVNPDLTIGADVTTVTPLKSAEGVCSPGVKLHGAGFIISLSDAEILGLGKRQDIERHIRLYRNGRDLTSRPRDVMVIDLFGLDARQVRTRFPELYQHLAQTVKSNAKCNSIGPQRRMPKSMRRSGGGLVGLVPTFVRHSPV